MYFAGLLVSPLAQNETEIIVYAPAGQPNSTVQIVVQNSDGQRASRNFVYLDAPPPEPGAPEISDFDPNVVIWPSLTESPFLARALMILAWFLVSDGESMRR